jgi:hypothetical protein
MDHDPGCPGKAGGGWVGSDDFTVTNLTTGASVTVSNNNRNSGWLVGAGHRVGFPAQLVGEARVRFSGAGQPVIYCSSWVLCRQHFHPEQSQHPDGEGGDQLPVQLEQGY